MYVPAVGVLAQLGEQRLCKAKVIGSIPIDSTRGEQCSISRTCSAIRMITVELVTSHFLS